MYHTPVLGARFFGSIYVDCHLKDKAHKTNTTKKGVFGFRGIMQSQSNKQHEARG